MAVICVLLVAVLGVATSTVALLFYGTSFFMSIAIFYSVSFGALVVFAGAGLAKHTFSTVRRATPFEVVRQTSCNQPRRMVQSGARHIR